MIEISQKFSFSSLLYLRFPIFISTSPITIQTISRTRVIRAANTPYAPDKDKPATARAKPPSLPPNCMGRKKSRLASREEKATIRMQPTKLTSVVNTFRINQTSRHPTMRAVYSNPNAE